MIEVVIFGIDPWTDQKFCWDKEYDSGCTFTKIKMRQFEGVVNNGKILLCFPELTGPIRTKFVLTQQNIESIT